MSWITVPSPRHTRRFGMSGLGDHPVHTCTRLPGMGGLGFSPLDAVAAIVGPVAQAGASIYATRTDAKASKAELKQRAIEAQQQAAAQAQQDQIDERQRELDRQASLQRSASLQATVTRLAPAAAALAGLGLVTYVAVKVLGGKKKGRK